MSSWFLNYLLTFAISILLGGLIIPKILDIAFSRQLFDDVNERKIHKGGVPRLGGISFLPAIGVSICLVVGTNFLLGEQMTQFATGDAIAQSLFLVCGLLLIYLVGIVDDLIGLRYRAKFLFQAIAALLLIIAGVRIGNLDGFLWIHGLPLWVSWLLTWFVIIFVMNAINLIDGIDGLASGLTAIALLWYSCVFFVAGMYPQLLLCAATIGTLVPFFYYNVFHSVESQRKIFMGDTGSLTIGLILVFLTVKVFNIPGTSSPGETNLFILAIAPIMVPCFDVVRVFFHRVRRGRNPFLADKCHIHHKLLALGMKQGEALITILLCDALFILVNLWLSPHMQPTWLVLCDIAVWTGANIILTHFIRRRENRMKIKLFD